MKNSNLLKSVMAVILGILAGATLMFIMGHNPFEGYFYLLRGGLMSLERIANTIGTATPLILTGLSVAFAFRTGLFNIGAPGQMLFGGFCATTIGLTFTNLPRPILLTFIILGGIAGGAFCAGISGFFKAKFNVHEVVSTIMLNWTIYWIVYYIIPKYFRGDYETESAQITSKASLKAAWISELFDGSFINYGILLALIGVILVAFIINKTTLGYELKSVGFNRYASEYAGMPVNRNVVVSMMIAGGLAGLAGVTQYVGNAICLPIGVLPNQGFDGIAVALLGNNSPIGVLFAALFFGLLYAGKGFMTTMASVPPEIADTIMATIIYFAATSVIMDKLINYVKERRRGKKDV